MFGKRWLWYLKWYYNQSSTHNLVEVKLYFERSGTINLCFRVAQYQEWKIVCVKVPYRLGTGFKLDGFQKHYDPILLWMPLNWHFSCGFLVPYRFSSFLLPTPFPSQLQIKPLESDELNGDWLHSAESTVPCLSTVTRFLAPSLSLAARLVSLPSPKHTHSWLPPSGQSSLEVTQAPGYGNANYNKHGLVTS